MKLSISERRQDEENAAVSDAWFVTSRIIHTGVIFVVTYGTAKFLNLEDEPAKEVAILVAGAGYFENDAVRRLSNHLQAIRDTIRR